VSYNCINDTDKEKQQIACELLIHAHN